MQIGNEQPKGHTQEYLHSCKHASVLKGAPPTTWARLMIDWAIGGSSSCMVCSLVMAV